MPCVGEYHQVEVFVGLLQGIHHQVGIVGWHIIVHTAMGQHEFSFQVTGIDLVGLFGIVRCPIGAFLFQPDITLAPVVFVIAVIVITGFGNAHFIKVRVSEHGVGRCKAATRMSPDAYFVEIHVRACSCQLFDSRNLVVEGIGAHVTIAYIVE